VNRGENHMSKLEKDLIKLLKHVGLSSIVEINLKGGRNAT
jgi:hypothetical protein